MTTLAVTSVSSLLCHAPQTMMYGFFAKRTDPPSSSLLFWLPASSFLPSPATFPDPLSPPIARSRDFHHASGVGRMPFCMSIDGCTGRRLQLHSSPPPLVT